MSAIGNRLAGYPGGGNNGVVTPSLYNNTGQKPHPNNRAQMRTQSCTNIQNQRQQQQQQNQPPTSSLQRLYDNQPRDNSINFKPPSAQYQNNTQKQSLYQKSAPSTPLWAQKTTTPTQPPFNPTFNPTMNHNSSPSNNNHNNSPHMSKSSTYTQFPTSDLYSTSTTGNMYYSPKPEKSAAVQAIELADKVANEAAKTFRVTKQMIGERYGQATRTIDQEVQEKMQEMLHRRDKYKKLQTLASTLTKDYAKFAQSQLNFGECLKDVGVNTPELHDLLIQIGKLKTILQREEFINREVYLQLFLHIYKIGIW